MTAPHAFCRTLRGMRTASRVVSCLTWIVLPAFFVMPALGTVAQHDFKRFRPSQDLPAATCNIEAWISTDSQFIKGRLELDYRNLYSDSLSEVWLQLPLNAWEGDTVQSCRIDSILFEGVPLRPEHMQYDHDLIRLSLPRVLKGGDAGFFLVSFTSRLGPSPSKAGATEYVGWYPVPCVCRQGRWYYERGVSWAPPVGEFADYNVRLRLDTACTLVPSGRLLNEQEVLGFLPKPPLDSFLVDITRPDPSSVDRVHPTGPVKDGTRLFVARAAGSNGFSFVTAKGLLRDRARLDSLQIDVCYEKTHKRLWQRFVVRTAVDLVKRLQQRLGRFPGDSITIVAASTPCFFARSRSLVVIPPDVSNKRLLTAALASGLAGLWFPPTTSEHRGGMTFDDRGYAWYAAAMILRESFGDDGFAMMDKYREYLLRQTRVARGADSALQRTAVSVCGSLPLRLYALRFVVGDSALWTALSRLVADFRADFPSSRELPAQVSKVTGPDTAIYLDLFDRPDVAIDYGIKSATCERRDSQYDVSFELSSSGPVSWPVEVAVFTGSAEAVYDTLTSSQTNARGEVEFMVRLGSEPVAVVVDPNYFLPDSDRHNNSFSFTSKKYKHKRPAGLFPGMGALSDGK
jgi:hypothetical protein